MSTLTPRDVDHIFESLRKGLVPERGIDTFAVGIGKVIRIDHSTGKLVIEHQAIPGYMGAMTMPYSVSSPHLLEQVKAGMKIKFRLDKKKNVIVGISPITG